MRKEKKGIVLEGGGLRGMFTAGVLDAMLEENIAFDGMIGVSAGSLFGCNYKSKQKGRALRYNIRLKNHPDYMGLKTLLRTGDIVGAHFAYHVVPFDIDVFDSKTFEENPMEFWEVCTDIIKGKPIYHQVKSFTHHELEWFRASASMPVVSHPVNVDGRIMLDGGITDSIPLRKFQEMGYSRNIVVLTQPRSYFKKPMKIMPLIKFFTRKYPKVGECMEHRYIMYNDELEYIAKEEEKGNTLIIAPDEPLKIGRTELNEDKMRKCHNLGYNTTQAMMPKIKKFLGNE